MIEDPKIQDPSESRLEPVGFSKEHQRPVYRREDVLREAERLSVGPAVDLLAEITRRNP